MGSVSAYYHRQAGTENDWPTYLDKNDEFLEYLRQVKLEKHVLSNSSPQLLEQLKPWFVPPFESMIASRSVGMSKREPKLYTQVCQQLTAAPNQTIFVDDRADNCQAAEAAGLTVVQFVSTQQGTSELVKLLYHT